MAASCKTGLIHRLLDEAKHLWKARDNPLKYSAKIPSLKDAALNR
jgi:hypothetical protein